MGWSRGVQGHGKRWLVETMDVERCGVQNAGKMRRFADDLVWVFKYPDGGECCGENPSDSLGSWVNVSLLWGVLARNQIMQWQRCSAILAAIAATKSAYHPRLEASD